MEKKKYGAHSAHAAQKRKKKTIKRKGWLVAAVVVLCILVLAVIALIAYDVWAKAPNVNRDGLLSQTTAVPVSTPEVKEPSLENRADSTPSPQDAQPSPAATEEPLIRRDDTYTLLVVGRDRVGMNTDTIMVARMDCAAGTVDVISIPRDTLVNVPWAVKKANSIYGTLGTEGLIDGIEALIGFKIDNYVIVNTYVFQQLIDCIGGVYFDVPIYMYYDDPGQDLHIHLSPGYQLLNGYQAEKVVRFRQNNDGTGYPDGDLGRINTQHDFFKALARQVLSLGNIANLPQMISIVTENTDTNLTSGNIAFYAQEFLKIPSENVNFYTMPYDTVYIRGGSYVSIQLQPWLDMINAYLNPFNKDVKEENLDVITYSDAAGFYSTTGSAPGFGSFYDYFSG